MTTMTDTRAALDAAIRDLTDQIGCAPHHRDTLVATLDNRIAAHVTAEVARQTVTIRRDLDEARELRHVVCDRCGEPIQWAAPGRTACPCSVAVAAAPEVEAAIDVLINAEDIDTRECVDAERGYIRSEDSRAGAIAAVISPAVHELRNALPPVRHHATRITGDDRTEARRTAMLSGIGRALTVADELAATLDGAPVPLRPTPDEARRLVDEYDRATRHSYVTGGPEHLRTTRAALLRALGVEA